ncbi:LuxR C-terminal-related transcriptional regulator [Microbacterium dextranolyticum]|uniref:Helix-turn-helix transcriptional regulator n=1 Tax=Microbacterium dextranolyticum TaxID=36806 RepID=A0A9W6HN11_9MICO|nr:LuxR C-terminal-related transcriptional regulator [Microbacterium dextranolyticum]MBM7463490.1 DNA-binding CsgD family transcriptional regulator [Microbacterium dextranolyticum]GLJ95409.1 helix-turn-helix transcriptional regulator [Microbacterium dextranolyticum]
MSAIDLKSEDDLLSDAVGDLASRTGLPVAFGGFEREGAIDVTAVVGNRTPHLASLVVKPTRGLGGRAFVERRPRLALDYRSSRNITHDYDRAVLGEGISTLFAVPILVAGKARGVIYCGAWSRSPFGESAARSALQIAADLATELRVRDEVGRRLQLASTPEAAAPVLDVVIREELREAYAELRRIGAEVADAGIRRRLADIEQRLATLSRDGSAPIEHLDVRLSRRETDVLACAALGQTNAEIAATLSLREGTVKSYLQAAMAKLDAGTRHAAVTKARRAGLLP